MNINIKKESGFILCYESRNRYKVSFNTENNIAKLYYLNNDIVWKQLDSFNYEGMSQNQILDKSKEFVNVWKGEPIDNVHHITELN